MENQTATRRPNVLDGRLLLTALGVAALGVVLVAIGNWWTATEAQCPGSGSGTSYLILTIVYLVPAVLFVVGGEASRRGRSLLPRILCGAGAVAAFVLAIFSFILWVGVGLSCANTGIAVAVYPLSMLVFFVTGVMGLAVTFTRPLHPL